MSEDTMNGQELPDGWQAMTLGQACDFTMGQSPPSETYNTDKVGMPFLQGKAEFTSVYPEAEKYCSLPLKIGQKGSALISVRAPVGDVNLADRDYIIGRGLAAIRIREGDDLFLFYLLLHNKKRIAALGSGTTFQSINKATLDTFTVQVPSLPEQRAIAHALRTVQAAREARRREAVLERERKAALMQQLFTHGTRGEPTKTTDIGEVPVSWKLAPFSELVYIVQGQVDPKAEPYCDMPHVGPENIGQGTGQLSVIHTNRELKIISGNYYFTTDHVLYSKIRPYLNKVALPDFAGTCSADMYPLQPRQGRLTREFLFYCLLSEQFKTQATAFQNRTGIPKINRDELNSIPVPEPPLAEQRAIAEVLRACDDKIAALEREAALHDELFRALLEELMTGRRRMPLETT